MKVRRTLTHEQWVQRVQVWIAQRTPKPLPPRELRRIAFSVPTSIRLATAGSTRHARALLLYWHQTNDPRVAAYLEQARGRYNADHDRKHRGMERALGLLACHAGVPRESRGTGLTKDGQIEAAQLFQQHVRRLKGRRGAEKIAVSLVAEALGVSERVIRESLRTATPKGPIKLQESLERPSRSCDSISVTFATQVTHGEQDQDSSGIPPA